MDKLANDACLAMQNGMTYGKYMASKPPQKPEPKPEQQHKVVVKRICAWCGKEFVRYDNRHQIYCGDECKAAKDQVMHKTTYRPRYAKSAK